MRPGQEESDATRLLAAIQAARLGDLRRALEETGAAGAHDDTTARLATALHSLIQEWQASVSEKESLLAQLQLSQAEVEDTNDRLRAEIEERKRTEAQLASLQSELVRTARAAGMSEVATGVLHNVGNVLNSINVAASTLRDRLSQSKAECAVQATRLLLDNGERLAWFLTEDPRGRVVPRYLAALATHQVERDRELAKEAEALCSFVGHVTDVIATYQSYGRNSCVPERLRPMEIVGAAMKIMATSFDRHAIEVSCTNDGDAAIVTDRHKVLQILINLLTNARDAVCDRRGDQRIEVRVHSTTAGARIAVSDNGVGIAPDNLARIFSFGFSTKPDGHGFSLHSSANAAKELGGALHAESAGNGHGATFVLELPTGGPTATGAQSR